MPQDKFQSENPYILTAKQITADNNQTALNVSLDESKGLQATAVILQSAGLNSSLNVNPVGQIPGAAASQTIGAALSGAAGGGGAGEDGILRCPEWNQYVRVQEGDGYVARRAKEITLQDFLWNPIRKKFEKVAKAEIKEGIDLVQIICGNRIEAIGSTSHPLIRDSNDSVGLPLNDCSIGVNALTERQELEQSEVSTLISVGTGTVVHLETIGKGHIYSAGTLPNEMVVWHNLKPEDDFE